MDMPPLRGLITTEINRLQSKATCEKKRFRCLRGLLLVLQILMVQLPDNVGAACSKLALSIVVGVHDLTVVILAPIAQSVQGAETQANMASASQTVRGASHARMVAFSLSRVRSSELGEASWVTR